MYPYIVTVYVLYRGNKIEQKFFTMASSREAAIDKVMRSMSPDDVAEFVMIRTIRNEDIILLR